MADGLDGDEDFQPASAASHQPHLLFFSLGNLFFILFNCGVGTLYFGGYRIPL